MNLLLDVDPSSAGYKAGYVFGIVLGVAIMLGGFAFSIVAVVKAFTRRTTGWIIMGSICGVFLLILGGAFTAGVINGVMTARRNAASRTDTGVPAAPVSDVAQTIQGRDIPYQVVLPPGWGSKRGVNDFDLIASRHSLYFGVIAEEGNLGSPENVLDFAQNKLRRAGSEVQFSAASTVKIDGRDWLQFTAKCQIQKIPFGYQYAVYAGPEGSYQVVGWTLQNLFDRDVGTLRDLGATFRFPPASSILPAASPGPAAALPPRVLVGDGLKYKLTVPDDWMVKRRVGVIDLEVSHHAMYVGVVAEEASLGTPQTALKVAQTNLRNKATELQISQASPVKIDGRDWLQFTASCKVDGIPFVYHYFVYAGAEGSYQILGWSMQNLYEREAAQINDVATTFQFPPDAPTAPAATPPMTPPAAPRAARTPDSKRK